MYCNVSMLSILIANDNTISHKIYTCAKHFFTPAPYMKRDNLYLKRLNYCISMLPASSDTKMDALIDFSIPKIIINISFVRKLSNRE